MTTTRAAQAARTREAILATARRLIAEQGFDATSLQQIAAAMGVGKAHVYYYFKTKTEILDALLTPFADSLEALLDQAASAPEGSGRADILITGFVDRVLAAYRSFGSLGLGDPALRRDLPIARRLDSLAERGLQLLYGSAPTPEQEAGYWLMQDLGPVLRRLRDVPEDEVRRILITLCRRIVGWREPTTA